MIPLICARRNPQTLFTYTYIHVHVRLYMWNTHGQTIYHDRGNLPKFFLRNRLRDATEIGHSNIFRTNSSASQVESQISPQTTHGVLFYGQFAFQASTLRFIDPCKTLPFESALGLPHSIYRHIYIYTHTHMYIICIPLWDCRTSHRRWPFQGHETMANFRLLPWQLEVFIVGLPLYRWMFENGNSHQNG